MSSRPERSMASMKSSRTSTPRCEPPPDSVVIMPILTSSAWAAAVMAVVSSRPRPILASFFMGLPLVFRLLYIQRFPDAQYPASGTSHCLEPSHPEQHLFQGCLF